MIDKIIDKVGMMTRNRVEGMLMLALAMNLVLFGAFFAMVMIAYIDPIVALIIVIMMSIAISNA